MTVGSRVRFIVRWIASPSSGERSRTRTIGEGGNPFPGKVLASDAQETLDTVSGRGTRRTSNRLLTRSLDGNEEGDALRRPGEVLPVGIAMELDAKGTQVA